MSEGLSSTVFIALSSVLVLLLPPPQLLSVLPGSRTDTGVDRGAVSGLHLWKHRPKGCNHHGMHAGSKRNHCNITQSALFSKAMSNANGDCKLYKQIKVFYDIYLLASSFFRHDLKEVMRSIDLYPWREGHIGTIRMGVSQKEK